MSMNYEEDPPISSLEFTLQPMPILSIKDRSLGEFVGPRFDK